MQDADVERLVAAIEAQTEILREMAASLEEIEVRTELTSSMLAHGATEQPYLERLEVNLDSVILLLRLGLIGGDGQPLLLTDPLAALEKLMGDQGGTAGETIDESNWTPGQRAR